MRDAVDACLTKAFRDVAVPEGLAERLLAGLAVAQPRSHRSRRWLLVAGGLLTAAATIVFAVWLGIPKAPCVSEEFACETAIQSFENGFGQPGRLLANRPAPAAFPFSPQVLPIRGTRWQNLNDFLGHPGVVYELPGPAGTHAALYVVACKNVTGVGTAPSAQPTFTTAGCCASAWQDGGLLYVLVVEGDRSMYGRYLIPRSPVA